MEGPVVLGAAVCVVLPHGSLPISKVGAAVRQLACMWHAVRRVELQQSIGLSCQLSCCTVPSGMHCIMQDDLALGGGVWYCLHAVPKADLLFACCRQQLVAFFCVK